MKSIKALVGLVVLCAATAASGQGPIPDPIGRSPFSARLVTVATGVQSPTYLTVAGDGSGRRFILEQTGRIRILDADGTLVVRPFLDLSDRLVDLNVFGFDERGLLGLAFHPGFDDPTSPGFGKLYTYSSEPVAGPADFEAPGDVLSHQSVVAEWTVDPADPGIVDPASRRELFRVEQPQSNHNAGNLAFGPDGYLYVSFGDGGATNDAGPGHSPEGNGQDPSNILGSITRIEPLAPSLTSDARGAVSANGNYRVPGDNPFAAAGDPGVDEIFAYGFRNPLRFSFDSETDALLVGDVGQANIEEVNLVELGGNYGWALKEGSFLFDRDTGAVTPGDIDGLIDPIFEYDHVDGGTSVIGGFVYRGEALPDLVGRYIFGDFGLGLLSSGRIFEGDLATGEFRELLRLPDGLGLRAFGQGEDGELFVLAAPGGSTSSGIVFSLSAIPEPSTLASASIGAICIAGYHWRRRRAHQHQE